MPNARHKLEMPKGPKGEERHADVASNAVRVMMLATGQIEEAAPIDEKNSAAAQLGKLGGLARAKNLTAKELTKIAKKGANARWKSRKSGRK